MMRSPLNATILNNEVFNRLACVSVVGGGVGGGGGGGPSLACVILACVIFPLRYSSFSICAVMNITQ